MTNASCADCGRIVAFRTHDPSEIAECRNCGIWVKRSAEMPGVAVSVKQDGPIARKTALPPRKDEVKDAAPNPNINTSRSAAKRPSEKPNGDGNGNKKGESMAPAVVYAAIRDLQNSVNDLRSGQKSLQTDHRELKSGQKTLLSTQKELHTTQKALHEGQKALHSGQKQLFGQYQEIQKSQHSLHERILQVPDMPVSKQVEEGIAAAIAVGPLNTFQEGPPSEESFFTTPFSSLKIPLIPIRLEDLDIDPQFTEEGSAPAIPVAERSDRVELIEKPLPEPPPYVAPEVIEEPKPVAEEASPVESVPEPSPFQEAAFDDTPFESIVTEELTPQTPSEAEEPKSNAPIENIDPFLTTATHESPFTIEGPPSNPFTVAGEEATTPEPPKEEGESPFAQIPQPFGATEYTHEPCEIKDPFAEDLPDSISEESEEVSPSEAPIAETLSEDQEPAREEKSLSQQIATAKENQESNPFDPTQDNLLTEPLQSRALPIVGTLLALLALLGACLFFFTDLFKKEEVTPPVAALVSFPPYGIPLPKDDPRIAEAEEITKKFLEAKTQKEVETLIRPVDSALLIDFWEPMTAPTIERIFQGRILENDRVEVDFLVQDFGRDERLLPLIKIGDNPFQVDWKSFAECEEVTLLGLAQGTLILDSGEEVDEGAVRSWMQSGKEMSDELDLGNFQGFKLHNFTEEVVAFAVTRKDSPEFKVLTSALASTELKHKGKPAIRTVLEVKRIEKEDPKNNKPARLEILKVLSTDWTKSDETEDELIEEKLPISSPPAADEQPSEVKIERKAPVEKQIPTEETLEQETANKEKRSQQLPPVPDETDPLAHREEETPLLRLSFD